MELSAAASTASSANGDVYCSSRFGGARLCEGSGGLSFTLPGSRLPWNRPAAGGRGGKNGLEAVEGSAWAGSAIMP